MTPTEYYQKLIESDQILNDDQQVMVVGHLQVIYDHLIETAKKRSFIDHLTRTKNSSPQGLYLWGEVGIGKTFLMDSFYYCLPFKNKLRTHFHKFMRMVQEQLAALQGQANPLVKIAKKLAKETCVICFDELIVNDIADAMLLAGLFDALYKEKICLLFTSNTAPDNLYLKGLQRESFLPAIELIKKNSDVIHLSSHNDYRFKNYNENLFYYTPLDKQSEQKLQAQFALQSRNAEVIYQPLRIYDRNIKVQKRANGVAWFDFLDICGIPRSQNDYLALASEYHTFIVSNVTSIASEQNDLARSFINLVDVLYDANKKLIISAEKPLNQLYLSGRMLFDFSRTRSRLTEMQTLAWQKKCDELAII